MHSVIEEILRVKGVQNLQPQALYRFQRMLRDDVQPLLDERDRLLVENAALKAQLEKSAKKRTEAA